MKDIAEIAFMEQVSRDTEWVFVFVPISFVVLGFMEYAEITDMMMMMRVTKNYCLCPNHFERKQGFRYLAFFVSGRGARG